MKIHMYSIIENEKYGQMIEKVLKIESVKMLLKLK